MTKQKGYSSLRYQDVAQKEGRLRALTTLTPNEFTALVPAFETCFLESMRTSTIDGLERSNRRYVTYKNSPLPTIEDKLLFILVHMKQNLTQEVQGHLFGMTQSVANKWLQLLRPVLQQALQRVEALPSRNAMIVVDPDSISGDSVPLFTMMAPNVRCNDQ